MAVVNNLDDGIRESICMIGNVFGALFQFEPYSDGNRDLYALLGDLDAEEAASSWPFASGEEARTALERMQKAIRESASDELLWEYRRLFVGPAPKAAPPWGSVYLDKDQVIFGTSTLDLRGWMRENGIAMQGADREPEDHIGRMLFLMSWLAENRPELLGAFLQEHFLTWAPHFLEVVVRESESDFFQALAQLCAASLQGIEGQLELEVPAVRYYR